MLIDTDALLTAAKEYDELLKKAQSLYNDIEELSTELREAVNTPGGEKFSEALDNHVLVQIDRQMTAIKHVRDELRSARVEYFSVFEEYQKVVRMTSRSK